jgi:hypothetical protein
MENDMVYWVGQDGNIYLKTPTGVVNAGSAANSVYDDTGYTDPQFDPRSGEKAVKIPARKIADPALGGGGGSTVSAEDALRASLLDEIRARGGDIDKTYAALFGDLDTLLKSRSGELETQYGQQLKSAGDQYAAAIPQIETSYAALGAGDSTDTTYAKIGAEKGFEDTTKTIGENKKSDQAKLGQYGKEQEAKFKADQEAAKRNVARAGETTDTDALRGLRNDLETNLSEAGVTRASLGTDEGARGELSRITADKGRYQSAVDALDSILKSSLSGGVKQAAVKAVADSSGLSDEEKKKIQETYGNVYAEQAAL